MPEYQPGSLVAHNGSTCAIDDSALLGDRIYSQLALDGLAGPYD